MSDNRIKPIVMPKWGLSMKEGKVTGWLAEEGTKIDVGKEILEVETDKIAGVVEAADSGVLRRRVGTPDTVYPVKALLGVVADDERQRCRDRRLCLELCDAGGRGRRGGGGPRP